MWLCPFSLLLLRSPPAFRIVPQCWFCSFCWTQEVLWVRCVLDKSVVRSVRDFKKKIKKCRVAWSSGKDLALWKWGGGFEPGRVLLERESLAVLPTNCSSASRLQLFNSCINEHADSKCSCMHQWSCTPMHFFSYFTSLKNTDRDSVHILEMTLSSHPLGPNQNGYENAGRSKKLGLLSHSSKMAIWGPKKKDPKVGSKKCEWNQMGGGSPTKTPKTHAVGGTRSSFFQSGSNFWDPKNEMGFTPKIRIRHKKLCEKCHFREKGSFGQKWNPFPEMVFKFGGSRANLRI